MKMPLREKRIQYKRVQTCTNERQGLFSKFDETVKLQLYARESPSVDIRNSYVDITWMNGWGQTLNSEVDKRETR
eukprot:7170218-Pyramimonas_sp.AAC.2